MEARATRFASLFRGSPRGHGDFNAQHEGVTAGKKVEGPRRTVHAPATLAHFERHLDGTYGLGAVPLVIDPPGHTWWAAIDIDVYANFDLAEFARVVAARGFPLVVCRSKSGGPHCYAFFTEPVPAALVRKVLTRWATSLGFPKAEVFPKQDALAVAQFSTCGACQGNGCPACGGTGQIEDGSYYGNWINLPYQSGNRSTRYALSAEGESLTVDEFLATAELSRIGHDELEDFTPTIEAPAAVTDEEFPDAPPCLLRMIQNGVSEGARNTAVFNAALYLKRLNADEFVNRTGDFNQRFISPPLVPGDVHVITRSIARKDYNYQCSLQPLTGYCDRRTCETRRLGVLFGRAHAATDFGLELGQLTKVMTDPANWEWVINDTLVKFTSKEFMNQKAFLERVFDRTPESLAPALMRPRDWDLFWKTARARAIVVAPPDDATLEGQVLFHLSNFCTGRARAKTLEEMLLHKPYFDDTIGRDCFMVADFIAYLAQQRVSGVSERFIYVCLRVRGLQSHNATLKGKIVAYWSIGQVAQQTEKFDVPRPEEDVPF